MALGATTWGIYYKRRPAPLTAVILCCSLSCNITAGIIIAFGGRRTRKVEEVEKRLRQALTEEAMRKMEKEKREEKRLREGGAPRELGLSGTISRKVDRMGGKIDGLRGEKGARRSEDSGAPLDPKDRKHGRSETSVEKRGVPSQSDVDVVDRKIVHEKGRR